jgi:hypothetical protein
VEPDRRRPARRAVRGHPGAARRHPDLAQGHGHLRVPLAGRRWHGAGLGLRQGHREGQGHRGRAAQASADDLEWTPGRFSVRGDPDKGVTIGEIALATFAAHNLPDGVEPSIDADATYDPDNFSFPHGTHLCATEVDTETGFVKIRSYVAVDDVGAVVNPLIVEGQVHGGLAQGIAQALYEEAVYDDDGNLVTSTLADYLVPSAADLPSYVTDRTESRAANSLGVKGVGEAGDRLDPGGGQRDRRRAAAAGHQRRRDALRRSGCGGPSRAPGAAAGQRGRAARGPAERPDPGAQPAGHRHPRPDRRRGMIPAKFDYVRPGSLDEAVSALAGGGDDAKVIAGGQSLLPLLRLRLAYPELLVDVGGLDELRGVTDAGDALVIGARSTTSCPRPALAGTRAAGAGARHDGRPGRRHRRARRLTHARRPGR